MAFSHTKCYFFQCFVGTNDILSVQIICLSANMYRQISRCTDKTPKKHYWGGGGQLPPPPCPPLATLVIHISSVASFVVLGGGSKPPNVPTKKNHIHVTYNYTHACICASERLRNILSIFRSQNTCYICMYIHNKCSSLALLMLWRYKRQFTDKTLILRKHMYICERAERASLIFFLAF